MTVVRVPPKRRRAPNRAPLPGVTQRVRLTRLHEPRSMPVLSYLVMRYHEKRNEWYLANHYYARTTTEAIRKAKADYPQYKTFRARLANSLQNKWDHQTL